MIVKVKQQIDFGLHATIGQLLYWLQDTLDQTIDAYNLLFKYCKYMLFNYL